MFTWFGHHWMRQSRLSGAIVDSNDNRLYPADIVGNVVTLIAETPSHSRTRLAPWLPLGDWTHPQCQRRALNQSNTNVTITETNDELYVLGISTAENIGVQVNSPRLPRPTATTSSFEGPVNVFNGSLFLTAVTILNC